MAGRTASVVRRILGIACLSAAVAPVAAQSPPADLLLVGGRVHTFAWDEPAPDGTPASNAPRAADGFRPDAEAVAIRGDRIVFVGKTREAQAYRGPKTRVIDVRGATVLPGLVDSHTHVVGLGEAQSQVDLVGVTTEAEAVARVAAFARGVPKGQWILGRGWDEGAWANRYPTKQLLSERVPDHPVLLTGLHTFAVWANRLALERAGLTRAATAPEGGTIVKDGNGEPTGILLNRATSLLSDAVPAPTEAQYEGYVLAGLTRMARDGYVAVHEAGADRALMKALQSLEAKGRLPVRVYAMLAARDVSLCRRVAGARARSRERPHAHHARGEGLLRRRARLARGAPPRRLLGPARPSRRQRHRVRLRPVAGRPT